jgi:hypothetical protein
MFCVIHVNLIKYTDLQPASGAWTRQERSIRNCCDACLRANYTTQNEVDEVDEVDRHEEDRHEKICGQREAAQTVLLKKVVIRSLLLLEQRAFKHPSSIHFQCLLILKPLWMKSIIVNMIRKKPCS